MHKMIDSYDELILFWSIYCAFITRIIMSRYELEVNPVAQALVLESYNKALAMPSPRIENGGKISQQLDPLKAPQWFTVNNPPPTHAPSVWVVWVWWVCEGFCSTAIGKEIPPQIFSRINTSLPQCILPSQPPVGEPLSLRHHLRVGGEAGVVVCFFLC